VNERGIKGCTFNFLKASYITLIFYDTVTDRVLLLIRIDTPNIPTQYVPGSMIHD
jgi:hypothetical protein